MLACSGVCGVILAIGVLRGYGIVEMVQTAISLAVASVPEGLPAVAATTLTLGVLKMRRHGVIIRKLVMGVGDGVMEIDGKPIYEAKDLRVGLFDAKDLV